MKYNIHIFNFVSYTVNTKTLYKYFQLYIILVYIIDYYTLLIIKMETMNFFAFIIIIKVIFILFQILIEVK